MNAISGYSSPAESPMYDNFEVGHTSTSVSLATGLQKARDIKGTNENIIAIIGHGDKRLVAFHLAQHPVAEELFERFPRSFLRPAAVFQR